MTTTTTCVRFLFLCSSHGNCNDLRRNSDHCLDFLSSYLPVRSPPVGPSLSEFELAQFCLVFIFLSGLLTICVVFKGLCFSLLSLLLLIRIFVFSGNVSFWNLGLVISTGLLSEIEISSFCKGFPLRLQLSALSADPRFLVFLFSKVLGSCPLMCSQSLLI